MKASPIFLLKSIINKLKIIFCFHKSLKKSQKFHLLVLIAQDQKDFLFHEAPHHKSQKH